ncbi:repeat element 33 protein [Diadegma fenestrale ichnovirus]|nr:repeat element 33 protein [Diadegma fenestrale ichnovirus]
MKVPEYITLQTQSPEDFLELWPRLLPNDVILHMSEFLTFEDYRKFVRALWPNGDEDDTVRKKLWQLSTHSISVEFCNGRLLEVEYNYDSERKREDRILINVENLLPIFGGVVPPVSWEFVSVSQLNRFIKRQIFFAEYPLARCAFRNDEYTPYTCTWYTHTSRKRRHSHPLLWKHVDWWVNEHLEPMIKSRTPEQSVMQRSTRFRRTIRQLQEFCYEWI